MLFMLIFLLLPPAHGIANIFLPEFFPKNDTELAETELYLLTVGRGHDLYMSGGHTMIRVVIPSRGSDVVLNWGIFDFSEPNFALKFFKGILVYRLDVFPTQRSLEFYSTYERRAVWQERITLTQQQRKNLLKRFAVNLLPENSSYRYDTFLNNCATIPRDHLNTVLFENLQKIFKEKPISMTFRDFSRYSLSDHIIENMFLDVVMNNQVDQPLTVWEQAFLPKELRTALMMSPAFDDQGEAIAGSKLLTDGKTLISNPEPTATPINGFLIPALSIALPTALGLYLRSRNSKRGLEQSTFSSSARICLALGQLGFGFWSGVFGLVHTLAWAFSEHEVLKHNLNLALFWPTDLYFIWRAIMILRNKADASSVPIYIYRYCQAHLVLALIWLLTAIGGWSGQDVSLVMLYLLPVHLLFFLSIKAAAQKTAS